jgi:hypothetical protein
MSPTRAFIAAAMSAAALAAAPSALAIPVPPDTAVGQADQTCLACGLGAGTHDGVAPSTDTAPNVNPDPGPAIAQPFDPQTTPTEVSQPVKVKEPDVEPVATRPLDTGSGEVALTLEVIADPDVVNEGNDSALGRDEFAHFHLRLNRKSDKTVEADYNTVDGTAKAGAAYKATTGHVVFKPGETDKLVNVPMIGDGIWEESRVERFTLRARNVVNAGLVAPGYDTMSILDDDPHPVPVTMIIENLGQPDLPKGALYEGNSGQRMSTIYFRLSNPKSLPIDVDWSLEGQGATPGVDFGGPMTGHIHFDPGETLKSINVPLYGDTRHEADEHFIVVVRNATNVDLIQGNGFSTIMNDDKLSMVDAAGLLALARGLAQVQGLTPDRHAVKFAVSCPEDGATCRGRLRLLAGSVLAGTKRYAVLAGATKTVKVGLSRRARRLMRHRGHLRLTLRSGTRLAGAFTLGDKVSLNPQPLPPKDH